MPYHSLNSDLWSLRQVCHGEICYQMIELSVLNTIFQRSSSIRVALKPNLRNRQYYRSIVKKIIMMISLFV